MSSSSDTPLMDIYEDWTSSDPPMMDPEEEAASALHEYQSNLESAVMAPPTQQDYEGPCHFLRLSRELRDMIYAEVLLVDAEIDPYPPAFTTIRPEEDDSDVPAVLFYHLPALLCVNRIITAEARNMFYTKNTWRVPNWGKLENETIFRTYPNYFTHIVMPFHQLDLPGSVIARISKCEHTHVPYMVTGLDGARARAVHQKVLSEAGELWENAWTLLKWYMKNMKHLKTITIDLENFACPSGCCRSRLWKRAGVFHQHFLKNLRPKTLPKYAEKGRLMPQVYVRGCLNEDERKLVCEDLKIAEAPKKEKSAEEEE